MISNYLKQLFIIIQMQELQQIEKDQNTPLVQALTSNSKFTPEQIEERKKIPKDMCEQGRKLLTDKNYFEASKSLSKAVMAFQFLLKQQLISQQQAKLLLKDSIIPSYSNLALCYLKLGHYESVISFANQVLNHDNAHSKSLYRRAMAYKNLKKFDEAIADLLKLAKINPSQQQLSKQQIIKCKQLKAEAKQKEKLMAKRLISGYQRQQSNPQVYKIEHLNFIGKSIKCIRETCRKIFNRR